MDATMKPFTNTNIGPRLALPFYFFAYVKFVFVLLITLVVKYMYTCSHLVDAVKPKTRDVSLLISQVHLWPYFYFQWLNDIMKKVRCIII